MAPADTEKTIIQKFVTMTEVETEYLFGGQQLAERVAGVTVWLPVKLVAGFGAIERQRRDSGTQAVWRDWRRATQCRDEPFDASSQEAREPKGDPRDPKPRFTRPGVQPHQLLAAHQLIVHHLKYLAVREWALRRQDNGFDDIIHVHEGQLIGVVPDNNQPLAEANTHGSSDEEAGRAPNLAGTKNNDR